MHKKTVTHETFYEGLEVTYKNNTGIVRFVCDEYITVCIMVGEFAPNDLCLLVYKDNWCDVRLLKESNK